LDFAGISLFNIMKQKLSYMSERQSVLAQNIANADTPGYKAKDVKEPNFKKMAKMAGGGAVRKLPMTLTDEQHIPSKPGMIGMYKVEKRDKTDELNPNENNVVIEEEMAKVASNQAEYQKVINLYGKAVAMFKTAIGNPNAGG
jgi:flagellar basal-body rod protein FlgB